MVCIINVPNFIWAGAEEWGIRWPAQGHQLVNWRSWT